MFEINFANVFQKLVLIFLKCWRVYVNWIKNCEFMGKSKISAIYVENHNIMYVEKLAENGVGVLIWWIKIADRRNMGVGGVNFLQHGKKGWVGV